MTPKIEIMSVPLGVPGGPDRFGVIEGRVINARPGQRIVLYARTPEAWWVQPFAAKPFTDIGSNSGWKSATHLGTEYAALLVDPAYVPSPKAPVLPKGSAMVLATAIAMGKTYRPKMIRFSGYDWEANQLPNNRGGKVNPYDAANAWTDANGFLHLRIVRRGDQWMCAEVALTHSLGQGSYYFKVRDVAQLDPAAVMTLYTWNPIQRFHGEVDVEISRWGHASGKNAQFVVQPYYEPANVDRFEAPPGEMIFSFYREPESIRFMALRSRGRNPILPKVAEHLFTSGVPASEGASVHMNLYAFGNAKTPMRRGAEVVIEKFEYLP